MIDEFTKDEQMHENKMSDIVERLERTFENKNYLKQVSRSRQRWLDDDIEVIAKGLVDYFKNL